MLPLAGLAILSTTGGNDMQMGMVVPIAAMGVEHHDISTPERLAPHLAKEIIQALTPHRMNALNKTAAL